MTRRVTNGHHTVTPHLIVEDAAEAIDFYKRAFDAKEIVRVDCGEKVGHAEIRIGNSRILLSDESLEAGTRAPQAFGGSPVSILLYVKDVDRFIGRAVAVGAKLHRPVEDRYYGDRSGSLEDPFGHVWQIATHKEDLTPAEMRRRAPAVS